MVIEVIQKEYKLKPNSFPQETFISLPFEIDEALYGGAAGGGKTFSLLAYPIFHKWIDNPNFTGIIFRKTFPQIEKSLLKESDKMYPNLGAIYNDQKHRWTFPSGATVYFDYMEKPKDAHKHKTNQYQYVAFEELEEFEEYCYTFLGHRCRSIDPNIPALRRNAATPGDIGNAWVRERFVEPYRDGFKVIAEDRGVDKHGKRKILRRIFIPAKLSDNVDLEAADPDYRVRLELLPPGLREAMLNGDWWAFEGQVFRDFREFHYEGEPDNAIHVIDPFVIPDYWPKLIVIDWGFRHYTWVGYGAVSPLGELVLFDEHMVNNTYISVWGADAARKAKYLKNVLGYYCDPSAWRETGEDKTLKDHIEDATGWKLQRANNDRIAGKMMLQELMRWKQRPPKFNEAQDPKSFDPDHAQWILRNQGLKAYKEYFGLYQAEKVDDKIPKLKIFRHCQGVIKSIQACVYDEEGRNKEDVKKFDGDDPYDGIRYMAMEFDRYVNKSKEAFTHLSKRMEIVERFRMDQDATSFYRSMELFEANQRKNSSAFLNQRPYQGYRTHGRVTSRK